MTSRRIYCTNPLGPLLNLLFAAGMVTAGLVYGGAFAGFPDWAYFLVGAVFFCMAPGSWRWMVLSEKGVVVYNFGFRLSLQSWWVRVEMDYDEIIRFAVFPRRVNIFGRSAVYFTAIESNDDRRTWLSWWSYAFSPACFTDLVGRIKAARGRLPEMVIEEKKDYLPRKRSLPMVLLSGLMVAAGVYILISVAAAASNRMAVVEMGSPAKAIIQKVNEEPGSWTTDVTLELAASGAQRTLTVRREAMYGRKQGQVMNVRVHPEDPSIFYLADMAANKKDLHLPALLALFFLFAGGRFFIRTLTTPVGLLKTLQQLFGQ